VSELDYGLVGEFLNAVKMGKVVRLGYGGSRELLDHLFIEVEDGICFTVTRVPGKDVFRVGIARHEEVGV